MKKDIAKNLEICANGAALNDRPYWARIMRRAADVIKAERQTSDRNRMQMQSARIQALEASRAAENIINRLEKTQYLLDKREAEMEEKDEQLSRQCTTIRNYQAMEESLRRMNATLLDRIGELERDGVQAAVEKQLLEQQLHNATAERQAMIEANDAHAAHVVRLNRQITTMEEAVEAIIADAEKAIDR